MCSVQHVTSEYRAKICRFFRFNEPRAYVIRISLADPTTLPNTMSESVNVFTHIFEMNSPENCKGKAKKKK